MSIAELRLLLHQVIDTVNDADKLEAIFTLLKGETAPYNSMTIEEYISAIDEARQQIKDGKHLSVDELEKESDNW